MEGKDQFAQKPKEGESWDVAIIGSGPAALTAAVYTTRGAASTLILGGESWGGQLMLTTTVDNFPGFPEGVQGPDLMQLMRKQAERFGAEFIQKNVESVDFNKEPRELVADGKKYFAKSVIIATGADTKWLGVPGEEKLRGRGVSSCAPCDAPFFKEKNVAVVGGGDSAMEEALVLTKYASSVTIIHRRDEFKASAAMQEKVMHMAGVGKIKILWSTEVVEMVGEEKLEKIRLKTLTNSEQGGKVKDEKWLDGLNGRVVDPPSHEATSFAEVATKAESDGKGEEEYVFWEMPLEGLFVAVGHVPATNIYQGKIELDEKGYIKKFQKSNIKNQNEGYAMGTSAKGVFVAGDVHDYHYRQAITAAGFGCMAGMDALRYLDKSVPNW